MVTLIDVGKGDCILIRTGEEDNPFTVMIDTGTRETVQDVLDYLSGHNVKKLDVMIISHFHKDHAGGAAKILKEIPVSFVYMPDYVSTKKVYDEMMEVLKEQSDTIAYERLTMNKSFSLGDAEYSLYPSLIEFDGSNDNDVSMAVSLEFSGYAALFAGDLEKDGIKQFLKNDEIPEKHYDILKLPHHGAEEKNTGDLLACVKTGGITVITDGQVRRAHGVLLDKLKDDGFRVYCNADDGTITITAGAAGYSVEHTKDPDDCSTEGSWKYRVLDDGTTAITGYTGDETEITLPSEISGHPVRSIADSAFYNHRDLRSVIIPESVVSIGKSAFSWCTSLTEISIPGSVTDIGDAAFSWCTGLENVMIPDNVNAIGASGFEHCTALKNIKLSKGLTDIAPSLFERCESLETIDIPAGVEKIGEDAFKHCISLNDVNLPASVTLIDEGAFKRCESLESIDIPEGVKTIEESAFERCIVLKSVKLPDSVTSLGKSAFQGCESLESVEIGDGVKTIKKSAFSGCTGLKSVTISASVEVIKSDAFLNCTSLQKIWYGGTAEQWETVEKNENWNQGTPEDLKVLCSDSEADPVPALYVPETYPGIRFFAIPQLPETGFSARQPKILSIPLKDLQYVSSGVKLQIPSLDVAEEIVTIPFRNGKYPVEWLADNIGLPEEFSAPGSGPAVLVGHNHLNTAEAGPFALLGMLSENAEVFIMEGDSNMMRFSVFANENIYADDMLSSGKLLAACDNSLVLVTCEDKQPEGGYASRRIVAAKPVLPVEEL